LWSINKSPLERIVDAVLLSALVWTTYAILFCVHDLIINEGNTLVKDALSWYGFYQLIGITIINTIRSYLLPLEN